jgi:putative hydrolase of HD superfamily
LVYLFSLEIDACSKRKYNNYFTGLFHDLPEVFTRDIISPIKESVEGLKDLIKSIESRYLRRNVYSLFPKEIKSDLEFFMKKGFSNTILRNGRRVHYGGTTRKYNRNEFSPCDGNLVKACDDLAAFIEAAVAIQNGCTSEELLNAVIKIKKKYMESSPLVCGINFGELYADF